MVYLTNTEIQDFVNKAQNKIADLSSLLVERGGNLPSALYLLLELSDFIECLDDVNNTLSEEDVIKYVHAYNHRANLNSIAYLLMTGIEVNLITGGSGLSLPITTADISDYITATNALIGQFAHNGLKSIQPAIGYIGFRSNEKYHINKTMYDKLYAITYPYTAPTVGLTLTASGDISPYGFYELGTSIATVTLQGSYTLNSGKSVYYYQYNKNGSLFTSPVVTPLSTDPVNSATDTNITSNTTYQFEANFEDGGALLASQSIIFKQPMFYGVIVRNDVPTVIPSTLTKIVRDKGAFALSFTMAAGNTSLSGGNETTPIAIFPAAWGNPISAKVGVYEFITDWTFANSTMFAADGITVLNIITGTFNNTVEGLVEFNFNFN